MILVIPLPAPPSRSERPGIAVESDLVARVRAGEHDAFEGVFRANYALLRAVAARLAPRDQSDEIVQDVFLSFWERRATLEISGSMRAYLLGAVRFAAASAVRRAQVARKFQPRVLELHDPPPNADALVLADERGRVLRTAVARLPERCRLVFELVRLEGLSYNETAAALGISAKTVDAQMGNALRRLRDELAPYHR